jgi:hypothetical protein
MSWVRIVARISFYHDKADVTSRNGGTRLGG